MLRSNGHLNVKRGYSLDTTCSHLAPNLVTGNAENRGSWELNFQNFPEEHFPNPVADPSKDGGDDGGGGGGGGGGALIFFFTKTKFTNKKLVLHD